MLGGKDVLARAALATVLRKPRARAPRPPLVEAHPVVDVPAAHRRLRTLLLEGHRPFVGELLRPPQPWMHLLERRPLVRQFAMEERIRAEVKADTPRRTEHAERTLNPRALHREPLGEV